MLKDDRNHLRLINVLEKIHERLWWVLLWLAVIAANTCGG